MYNVGHFDSKAMPSAGLLPFFQSMFCAANNTCHQTERPSEQQGRVYNYDASLYVSFLLITDVSHYSVEGCKTQLQCLMFQVSGGEIMARGLHLAF